MGIDLNVFLILNVNIGLKQDAYCAIMPKLWFV